MFNHSPKNYMIINSLIGDGLELKTVSILSLGRETEVVVVQEECSPTTNTGHINRLKRDKHPSSLNPEIAGSLGNDYIQLDVQH